MTSLKKIVNSQSSKNYFFFLIIFVLFNNLITFGSDNKSYVLKNNEKYDELEEIYRTKSISFSEYDKWGSQLKIFFGFHSNQSENKNYPDLSIIDTSDALRDAYIFKLGDMTINKSYPKIKKEVLFKN